MEIRSEHVNDFEAVYSVNLSAFDTAAEANLVNGLRQAEVPIISLVAEEQGIIIGHILFSSVTLSGYPKLEIMGLAPMAVIPRWQNQGIGTALVHAGLERCRQLSYAAVVVLGHPDYYPRFGFAPASKFNINSEYNVPDNTFMAMELIPKALNEVSGTIKYHETFNNL